MASLVLTATVHISRAALGLPSLGRALSPTVASPHVEGRARSRDPHLCDPSASTASNPEQGLWGTRRTRKT